MDAEDVAAANGASGVDHLWRRRLQAAIDETERAASLEDALRPLVARFAGEIDAGDLQAIVDGQRAAWRHVLYSEDGGFNLPPEYLLDHALAIYVYTLGEPAVFRVVNREMFNPARRKPGAGAGGGGARGVSDGLRACLPYIRFLTDALEALPERFVFRGQVRRGVKYAFPSPERHNPVGYFAVGRRLMWYEFKSTSECQEVMTRDHFCGVAAGPRTIFIIDVCYGFAISVFSFYQGVESEFEVLLLPLSEFVVVHAARNIIDATETARLERSGFPDTVHLRQVGRGDDAGGDAGGAAAPAGAQQAGAGQAQQEQADAALARALQEALDLERNTAPPAQGQGGAGAATSTIQVKGKCAHCGRDVLGTQQRGRGLNGEYFHADPGDCAPAPAAGQHSVPSSGAAAAAAAGPGPTLKIERGSGGSVGLRFRRPQGRAAGPFEIIAIEPHGPAALSGLGVCMCVCVHAWKSDTQTRACTRACTRTHMRARAHTHKLPHAHTHAQRPATTFAR
jgi:hypothetical protein